MKNIIGRYFLCVICCFGINNCGTQPVYANPFNQNIGARSMGLGGSSTTLNDIWAVRNNPAALVGLNAAQVGIYHGNPFLLKELSLSAIAVAKSINNLSTASLNYTQFGASFYKEQQLGIAYARALHEKLYTSVQFHYLRIATIADDESLSAQGIAVDIGLVALLTNNIRLGVNIFNPNRSKIGSPINTTHPTSFKTGISYTPSSKALMTLELEKTTNIDVNLKGGIEYHPHPKAYIRIGAGNNFTQPSLGGGFIISHFQIDFASAYHSVLGFSPAFSLTYAL